MLEAPAKRKKHLNLTPLIDIIFQLVIFFMLSTTFIKTEALDIFVENNPETEKPKVQAQTLSQKLAREEQKKDFEIKVLKNEEFLINGKLLNARQATEIITAEARENPLKKFKLIATSGANVQDLTTAIDVLKQSSAANIVIDSQ